MTSPPSWHVAGPPPRDELAAWTTIEPADAELGAVPPLSRPAPPGRIELVHGGGVNVRRHPGPVNAVPAVYVHGLGGASTDWTRLAAVLAPHATGYSLDLPGSGRSDPPPAGRYSPAVDARVVARTIEQVADGPIHLVGNSYGGIVATRVAAGWPHLVRTLTVLAPAVPDLRPTADRGADPRLGALLVPGTAALAYRRLASIPPMARARSMGELCFGRPEAVTERDYALAAREHAWRARLPWVFEATVGSLRGLMNDYLRPGVQSFAALAGRVQVPTLVVWGTRDRLVDVRLSRRAAAAYPDSRLLVLAGCGHVPQMEEPEATARGMIAHWRDAAAERPGPAGVKIDPGAPPQLISTPMATS
ncbi:alpha/beta fold hydrolase [Nakamurella sp.]|uniref:alpha/beta fold hydrolase n=1 Tax=Nakamurella sp. TaxID=1869182 RepID=UPI003783F3BE